MSKVIQLPPREILLTRNYFDGLASVMVALDLSRRDTPKWMAETLFRGDEDGFIILTGEGKRLMIHDDILEEAHGEDTERTCVSDMKRAATTPRKRAPRQTTLRRLQLYDAAFKLAGYPVRRIDRWVEGRKARKLLSSFSPVWRVRYHTAVRDQKRRAPTTNPVLYSQQVRALRLHFAEKIAQSKW